MKIPGVPIEEFLAQPGMTQKALADALGITQGNIGFMRKRVVFVHKDSDGVITAKEITEYPKRKSA